MLRARLIIALALPSFALFMVTVAAAAPQGEEEYGSRGNIWRTLSAAERQEAMDLSERFKGMISAARSELMMVRETIRFAEDHGFRL